MPENILLFLLKRWGLLCIKMFSPPQPVFLQRFRLRKILSKPGGKTEPVTKKKRTNIFAAFRNYINLFFFCCKVTFLNNLSVHRFASSQSTVRCFFFSFPAVFFPFALFEFFFFFLKEDNKMHRSSRIFPFFLVVRFFFVFSF